MGFGSEIESWHQPYHEAGHDIDSLFRRPAFKCARCGSYQIDLSEDLSYGDMRRCRPVEGPVA